MGKWKDRLVSTLKNLVLGTAIRWIGWALLTLLLTMLGAQTVADLLDQLPWAYVGVLVAAFLGFFLGGFWIEWRAVTRSENLMHWLANNATDSDDMDRVEWVFGFIRRHREVLEKGLSGVMAEGKVLSKSTLRDDKTTGRLHLAEERASDTITTWCILDRNSPAFRNAEEGDVVAIPARPLGVAGTELILEAVPDDEQD